MMSLLDLDRYIGKVEHAEIVANYTFETLNKDVAFIKRKLDLVLEDGAKVELADSVTYMEFKNSLRGREDLQKSDLDKSLIDAVMLIWGEEPTISTILSI